MTKEETKSMIVSILMKEILNDKIVLNENAFNWKTIKKSEIKTLVKGAKLQHATDFEDFMSLHYTDDENKINYVVCLIDDEALVLTVMSIFRPYFKGR